MGPRTFTHLLRRFGTATAALDALPDLARRGGRSEYDPCPADRAEREIERGQALGARLLTTGDAAYPPLLAQIDSAPPVLWVRGNAGALGRPAVAVVGARNASALGLRTARRLAGDLGERGYVVVSGLARGVDRAAHEAALASGTIGVLAGGVDRVTPDEQAELAEAMLETGALVSECAIGTEPTARHFPRRNRLISGLAAGVVLVEAALRSGSLITARFALDQGREVMACPGAPEDPRAGGCNQMIRDGAALIRTAADVVEALSGAPDLPGLAETGPEYLLDLDMDMPPEDPQMADLAALQDPVAPGLPDRILELLGPTAIEVDELRRMTGSRPAELSMALLELDLAGRVDLLPGGMIAGLSDLR